MKIKKITEGSWIFFKKSELISSTEMRTALLILLHLNVKINQLGEDCIFI